jgi:hypothetical protein
MFFSFLKSYSKTTSISCSKRSIVYISFLEGKNGVLHPQFKLDALELSMKSLVEKFNQDVSNMRANRISHRMFQAFDCCKKHNHVL